MAERIGSFHGKNTIFRLKVYGPKTIILLKVCDQSDLFINHMAETKRSSTEGIRSSYISDSNDRIISVFGMKNFHL